MTPDQLKSWRANLGLSQKAAAEAIGISVRSIIYYEKGQAPIPKTVELACTAIDSNQSERKFRVQLVTLKTITHGESIAHQAPQILENRTVFKSEVRDLAERFRSQSQGWVEVYDENGRYIDVFEPVFKDGEVIDIKYVGP